jgi:predicted enzyme related to lactoylglutathione lyase
LIKNKPAIRLQINESLTLNSYPVIQKEYERLQQTGVDFSMSPTRMGPSIIAVFKDTCGNNFQIVQV